MNWYLPEKASLSVLYTVKISYLLDRKCEFASRPQRFHVKNDNCADWRRSNSCSLCRLISGFLQSRMIARCNHLIGGGDAGDPTAMRS